MVERVDETLALLGRRRTPVLAEDEARRKLDVEMRQQILVHQLPYFRRILAVHVAVRVQLPEHGLRGVLYYVGRALHGSLRGARSGSALREALRLRAAGEDRTGQQHGAGAPH